MLMNTRTPTETTAAAHGAAGAAAGVPRARRPPRRWSPAARRPRPGRRNCSRPRAPRSMSMRRALRRSCWRSRRPAARCHRHPSPRLACRTTFAGAAIAVGACDDDDEAARFAAAARAARRAGQRHRQADVLRLLLRRHRQPLAARDRHLDRRRGAGVRPGDPRQARSADPARLRALGRGRAPLAARRASRPDCRSTAAGGSGSVSPHARCSHPDRRRRSRRTSTGCWPRPRPRAPRSSRARSRWSAPVPAIPNC